MRPVMHRVAVWINKVITAWRSQNAVKTNKGARDLSRAVRPSNEENEKTAECKHEWEEIGRHSEATEDHHAVFHYTDLQCKLCGEKGIREQTDYHW